MKKVTKNEKRKKYRDKLQKREESLKTDNFPKKNNLFKKEKHKEKVQRQESIINDYNVPLNLISGGAENGKIHDRT